MRDLNQVVSELLYEVTPKGKKLLEELFQILNGDLEKLEEILAGM